MSAIANDSMLAMYSIVAIANSIVANNNRINVISNNGVVNITGCIITTNNNCVITTNINISTGVTFVGVVSITGCNISTANGVTTCRVGAPTG